MKRRAWIYGVVAGVALGGCSAGGVTQQAGGADFVVWNAKVLTVDREFSQAQAVAIRDGVVSAVGANEDVKALIGAETRVIDAEGRTVVPGLIESHVHATGVARGEAVREFVQLHSIGEIQDWVRARAKEVPPGTWIQLPRVDVTRIREGRVPDACRSRRRRTESPGGVYVGIRRPHTNPGAQFGWHQSRRPHQEHART